MARGLNKAMLIGNVGQDPEIRATSNGGRVANLSLATSRRWKDGQGNDQEKTDWHRVTFFGKLVDVVEQWVSKGDRLYIEGRISYSQSEDERGNTRYWTDVIAREMVMLGGGGSDRDSDPAPERNDPPLSEPDDDLPF